MLVFLIVLWTFSGLGAGFSIWMLFRNTRVYNFRMALIDLVSDLAREDIKAGLEYQWRYDYYQAVSYDKMFWSMKPIKVASFYKSANFINPAIQPTKKVTKSKEKKK